jgi:uridine kinase
MSQAIPATDVRAVTDRLLKVRASVPRKRAALVAVSGIDGCGKGWLTRKIVDDLQARGVNAANINIDGWLNLPAKRFSDKNPAEHFYLHAIRFDEMFAQLVLPLRDARSIRVETDFAEETATTYRKQLYEFTDIDIIVLEGIYLLKQAFRPYYDLSIWIDCSFARALERALARGQEGLPPTDTIRAYETIYFPAQEIHFQRDNPQQAAEIIVDNN